jgi:hypothetical protein
VQIDDAPGRPRRYGLLEPLRQFAWDRLEEQDEVVMARERHAAFFLELFE